MALRQTLGLADKLVKFAGRYGDDIIRRYGDDALRLLGGKADDAARQTNLFNIGSNTTYQSSILKKPKGKVNNTKMSQLC